ncbi:hypothetical protein FOA52_002446 [Chlamydomonas sp. UWO 241]|nr:hypothetical protein FOA52_002446 [Chlamydomonas sp. UWO 241]
MAPVDNTPGGDVFSVVVHLPPGYHQYKFIVDGKWRHDETAPFMPDPLGNVNNWLFVRRIDATLPPGQSRDIPFEHLAAQAAAAQQALALGLQPTDGLGQFTPSQLAQLAQAAGQQHQQQQVQGGLQGGQGGAFAVLSAAQQQAQLQAAVLGQLPLGVAPLTNASGQPLPLPPAAAHGLGGPPFPSGIGAGGLPPGIGLGLHPPSHPPLEQLHQLDDIDMAHADAPSPSGVPQPPIVIHNPKEPEYTRKKISDFLHSHTAYELIPESGRVTVLDVDLPVRQAFHALHDQGVASAPLWDSEAVTVHGVISASDFISVLTRLRSSVVGGGDPMSEAEMDRVTIRGLREQAAAEGRTPKALVYAKPDDDLACVVGTLSDNKCLMCPVLSCDPLAQTVPSVLHMCGLSGVLACLMRHFRASLASLPLLGLPLGSLPLGTWSPDASVATSDVMPDSAGRAQWRRLQPLHTVTPDTPLTAALNLLLEAGVSCLPVVDERRCLLDVYARSDITMLCRGNNYSRLQWEDVTVGQALMLGAASNVPVAAPSMWGAPSPHGAAPSGLAGAAAAQQGQHGGLSAELAAAAAAGAPAPPHVSSSSMAQQQAVTSVSAGQRQPGGRPPRVHLCSKDDHLRSIVERLSVPGVRRLVVVSREGRVEGVVSLSDVADYLFS